MTHHGETPVATACGILLSVAGNAFGWVDGALSGRVLETLLLGIVGGIGGWIGKRLVDYVRVAVRTARANNNKTQRQG